MNDSASRIQMLRNLQGAPLSIIIALIMAGRALLASELEMWTGYSDKTITRGLALLETLRLIAHHGKYDGWSLTAAVHQLPLPLLFSEKDNRRNSGYLSSSSSSLILGPEEEEESRTRENRRNSDFAAASYPQPVDNDNDAEVQDWLLRGGVGQNSPKMRELLSLALHPDYVAAHVLERLAQVQAGQNYPVGWLINKMLCGDMAPPMRCVDCLQLDCYCDVIRR